jgi:outer membrane immunogenic protein
MKKIMKKLFLLATFAVISAFSFGQNSSWQGRNQLNFGIGLSEWGVPFYIGFDHYVHKDITIGGELSYRSYDEKDHNYSYHHSITGLSANGNYHFNTVLKIPRNWDFYAGLNLGFYIWTSPNAYVGSHESGLGLAGQIGGRYYFSNRIGLNLEFGGGNAFSGGKFGLTFKL